MKHAPQTIWLNVGEADDLDTNDFRDLSEVTWSENKVSSGDLKYVRHIRVRKAKREREMEELQNLDRFLKSLEESINDVDSLVNLESLLKKRKEELKNRLKNGKLD